MNMMNQTAPMRPEELKSCLFGALEPKAALRARMRKRRREQDPRLAAYKSKAIASRLLDMDELKNAGCIALYAATPDEVATEAIAAELFAHGADLLFPAVRGEGAEFFRVKKWSELSIEGAYGIREPDPVRCKAAEISEADVILAPGVAFDLFGSRIGYGGGYYDRLLAMKRAEAIVIAPAFEFQVVRALESEDHDIRVDAVVTEERVYRPQLRDETAANEADTRAMAASLIESGFRGVIALHGDLGVGKTCFVQGMAEALKTREAVASPTFVYCREYHGDCALYHADAYRLDEVPGYETDYWSALFEREGVVAVEWAEKLSSLTPKTAIHLHGTIQPDGTRLWRWFSAEGNVSIK